MCKMREEFEEWECNADSGPLTDQMWLMRDACSPENYGIVQVQHNWEVWRASREALVVDLSLAVQEADKGCHGNEDNVLRVAKDAALAAGLKVIL